MPKKVKPDAEIIELIAEYSVKGISQKAKEKLNSANDKNTLLQIYNDLIDTSDYMLENGDLSPQRQDKFEDEIWKEYKDLLKKKFGVKDSMKMTVTKLINDLYSILVKYGKSVGYDEEEISNYNVIEEIKNSDWAVHIQFRTDLFAYYESKKLETMFDQYVKKFDDAFFEPYDSLVWDCYIDKKFFSLTTDSKKNVVDFNNIGKIIRVKDCKGVLIDFEKDKMILQTNEGIRIVDTCNYNDAYEENGEYYWNDKKFESMNQAIDYIKQFVKSNSIKLNPNTNEYYEAEESICERINTDIDIVSEYDIYKFDDNYYIDDDIDYMYIVDELALEIEYLSENDLKETYELDR